MFKNSALQVKLVKTPTANDNDMSGAFEVCSSEICEKIIRRHVTHVALTAVAAYAAKKVLDVTSEIAINYATKK